MSGLSEKGKELCGLLKNYITEEQDFLAVMIFLTSEQSNPDFNYQKMINFLKSNSDVDYAGILEETLRIRGV